jgi:hypothetical protein
MSRLLVSELLKKLPEVPVALRELVTGGAEGNPFYMEELVRMLIDQGAIETGEVWKVNAERLLLTKVPTTLTGVLQARLDGLPAPERLTLQQASVIGPVFWDRALIALDAKANDTLPALVRRELALPRAHSNNDDLREYAFKHQILHQVTYATVLKRTRRDLHGKLARWLAAQTGLRANDFLDAAAKHFELAGDEANAASTTPERPSTRARGWPTMRCWTMCSGRWRCWTRHPRPADGCCAGVCSRCERPRWTVRATGSGNAQTSRRWPSLPKRKTTTGDAPMRRGGAAPWRSASPTTRRWKPPRGTPPNGPVGRVMPCFDCSRSGCWRCRSPSRGGPPKVGSWRKRRWPRRALWGCARSRVCA